MLAKLTLCSGLAAIGLLATPAAAADFKNKTIEWIIPFDTGGGSDVWARFLAPLLGPNLPGAPTIVVKNVPGGGSITGANQFAERARPDGLTILGTSGSTQFPYLLGDKRVKYDYKDWQIIFGSPTGGVVYVNPSLGVKSAKDMAKLRDIPMKYGSQSVTGLDLIPLLAFEIMELKVDAVFGMKSRAEGRLTFERGEAKIDYQTSSAYLESVVPLVQENKAVPLFSWGVLEANGMFARDPTFPDLPHFAEAYQMAFGKAPSGDAYEAYKVFVVSGFAAQKMAFLPKGAPADIVKAWRDAAAKTFATPGFRDKARQELGDYVQATDKAADTLFNIATTVEPKARDWIRNWLSEKYATKF
jgi:tripartite-type tricarboxylate transporter receptor subunit TctC